MMTPIRIKTLGQTDFAHICTQMQAFTSARTPDTPDELWVTTHPPVYSLGLNRKNVGLPLRDDIPLVKCDRGGKITYHGPGQLIIYGLVDLAKYGFTVRDWVACLEGAVIRYLAGHGVKANARKTAPGVYVDGAKVASLGLRLKQQRYCYHGLSINVEMDLTPFDAIDPCGYAGLPVAQLRDFSIQDSLPVVAENIVTLLQEKMSAASHASHA